MTLRRLTLVFSPQVIIKAVPTFERIHNALLLIDESRADELTPSQEALAQLHLDVERFVGAVRKCIQAIHATFTQRGLDPVFPPPATATN